MITLILLFLISFTLCYPLIEIFRYRKARALPVQENTRRQPVSVILCAYNEERNIERKIREILAEPIWAEGSELLLVSTGSTDKTNEMIASFSGDERVKAFYFPSNISKIEGLNFAFGESRNQVLVFSDCRQLMRPGSIPALLRVLDEQQIDVAAATLHNRHDGKSSVRNMLNRMNLAKAVNSNSMNIYGALYAQRRGAFTTIPVNVLFDDLYVLASTLAQGKKIRQVENAVIEDVIFENYYREERIQRLTRGLMLFLLRHFHLVRKMSLANRYHFLMSKYAKLLLPVLVFLLLLNLTLQASLDFSLTSSNLFLLITLAGISSFSKFLRLFFRVVYYTLKAEYLYIFARQRSVRWEKFTNY